MNNLHFINYVLYTNKYPFCDSANQKGACSKHQLLISLHIVTLQFFKLISDVFQLFRNSFPTFIHYQYTIP